MVYSTLSLLAIKLSFSISLIVHSLSLSRKNDSLDYILNIPSYERQALYDLYNSTNGYDWIYREGDNGHWNFTDPIVNPCSPSNLWQGLICQPSSTYFYITSIRLRYYNLNGFIPNSIGNFSHLLILDLSHNNNITNEIPYTIGNLARLTTLDLSFNKISGTIPSEVGNLSQLKTILDLSYNSLSGTIPSEIGKLSQLIKLYFTSNYLTRIIPNSIGNLKLVTHVYLSFNELTGTIPSSICDMVSLEVFSSTTNMLYGTIPSNLSSLKSLGSLSLSYNQLNGSIPNSIGDLLRLKSLYLAGNQLTDTIPSSLSNLNENLNTLSIGNNYISGAIPPEIGELKELTYLELSHMQLTGTIPSSLFNLTKLESIFLSNNQLTSKLPDLSSADDLVLIDVQLNDNHFTGTISEAISRLASLKTLNLQNNRFTGNLNNVFNASFQKKLENIRLSDNQFTGTLPEQVFLSGSLIAFVAVSNCFHGSIPSSICNNSELATIALDGLVCASSCQNKIIPGISNAYVSAKKITGGIPKCLWSMPNLALLHLSGNILTGSLPDSVNLSSSLVDLYLSYNALTGTIPRYIQHKQWENLDLSHNRFSGTLLSSYAKQSSNALLALDNNRLSGYVPNNMKNMKDIDILKGNFYNCKYDRRDLPDKDKDKDTYECGSDSFNVLYYAWLGLLVTTFFIAVSIWMNKNILNKYFPILSLFEKISKWLYPVENLKSNVFNDENNIKDKAQSLKYFKQYNAMIEMMIKFSCYCTIFIIVVLLPTYCVVSYYYRTHTYEYAWSVSAIYLSGKIAFKIVFSMLFTFMLMKIFLFIYSIRISAYDFKLRMTEIDIDDNQEEVDNNSIATADIDTMTDKKKNIWKVYSIYLVYIAVNLIVISGVNIAYTIVALYQSYVIVALVTVAVAIFKVIWNNILSATILRYVVSYLSIINSTNRLFQRRLFIMQLVVSLLNNILIPCFVVAIISPNCFYYIFVQESDVTTSSFKFKSNCKITYEHKCEEFEYDTLSTSYSPPFTYSYQCSADFITYYAPVFIFMCILSTFIFPCVALLIVKLSATYTWIPQYLPLGKLFLPVDNEIKPPLINRDQIYTFLVNQLTLIGLLLTFGAIFPPLAVAVLTTIILRKVFVKAVISRFVSKAIEVKAYQCLTMINQDCKVIPSLITIRKCGFIILSTCAIFYTLFLFDILGDEVGLKKAYWVLIVTPCIPMCLYMLWKFYIYWRLKYYHHTNQVNNQNQNNRHTTNSLNKQEFNDIYKNDIELSTTISSALMTSNPMLVVTNTTIDEEKEDRNSIIRDISVSDRDTLSICNSENIRDIYHIDSELFRDTGGSMSLVSNSMSLIEESHRESMIRDIAVNDRKGASIPDKTESVWLSSNEN